MNRDNLLFLVIGALAGFLGGYLLQESMAAVQPRPAAVGGLPADHPPIPGAGPGQNAGPELERLRQALELNPNDADALIALANLNFDIQNWSRAQELYERYLQLRPADPDALTDLGITLRAQSRFPEALEKFQAAQTLAPRHWQARFNEVIVRAFDLGDLAAAERALAELREIAPGNPDVERLAEEVRRRKGSG